MAAFLTLITTIVGLLVGAVALGGFIGGAPAALTFASDSWVRYATARGGLGGLSLAAVVVVLSAFFV